MTRSDPSSDSIVLRLTLATLVAFLLAGAGILVSANTQIPVIAGPQRLLELPTVPALWTPDHVLASAIAPSEPRLGTAPSPWTESALTPAQLKHNALSILRGLPDYYPSDNEYKVAAAQMNERLENQQLEINVNTFLLSQRISNESQLAELQMQPFFAEFDRSSFLAKKDNRLQPVVYAGVGFPHIESNNRSAKNRYKPYKKLMRFSDGSGGEVVPNVRCMGLSAERVAKRAKRYEAQIFELAMKHNVSASLIKAVVAKESCFNPKAKSPVGAIGLMQLMPETARWLKVKKPENPGQNLAGGVRYLAQLQKRFGGDELALAAYNAGPSNVERYHGIPPFAETENYVVDVMHFYRGYVATTRYMNARNSYQ